MKKNIIIIAIVVVIIGGLLLWSKNLKAKKAVEDANMTSREVAMLCTTDMATEFHIHPVLTIIIDGVTQIIPADIGITPTCMHSLHTHDADGTLHVESPIQKDFTLADFFAVWNKPFDQNHILDKATDPMHKITLTVNGVTVNTFENTILKDKDQIVISYKTGEPIID